MIAVIPKLKNEISIAVVDDDDIYRDWISTIISSQPNWRVITATNTDAAIDILDHNVIDCVLMDYNMGITSGLFIWEMIKARYSDPPPIIMLTGERRDGLIVKAFRGGFSDFVSKSSLNTRELLEAIRGAVDRKLVERIEKKELNRLSGLSGFDGETGLLGVDYIRHKAEELSASARRRGASFGAIIICVRELSDIGDAFGNAMRDRVFGAFAARVKRVTRAEDLCGRYTDDSFLYLIDRDVTHRGLWSVCERLSADLSFVVNFERASFKLAANIGMAFSSLDGDTATKVLAAAELALAHARETRVPVASASPVVSEPEGSTSSDEESARASEREASHFLATRQVDRRCERRHRVVKQGKVIDFANNSAVDCRIRDISNNGARITVNEYYSPPDQFTLLIIGSGEKRTVNVRWRIGNDIGVQYVR